MKFSDKRVMVVDHGLFVSWAARLAREFGEVYYHNPSWKGMSPSSNRLLIGHGLDEITMVKNLWDIAPKMDLFVFPFIYDGDLQMELQRQGKRVWGGRKGEELEIYRPEAKEEMARLGMPVGDYTVVQGLTDLRAYLKKHRNVHVKISLTRNDTESFHSPSYDAIETKLDILKHRVGIAAEAMEFTVEKPIEPAVEIGYDGFTVDGNFPAHAINGYEVKDNSYLGCLVPYESLDEHVRAVNKWLAPTLHDYRYRGLFSTEIRIGPDEKPYLIDLTCRSGSPPGESMQELIANWAEIMWFGSEGKMIDPLPADTESGKTAKYSAQAVIYGDSADECWQPISFPDEVRPWVKLFFHCRINDKDYTIPQEKDFKEIGWVVGTGNTVKEAIKNCEDHADQVSGYKLEVRTKTLQDAIDEIKKGEEMGVQFSDEPIEA